MKTRRSWPSSRIRWCSLCIYLPSVIGREQVRRTSLTSLHGRISLECPVCPTCVVPRPSAPTEKRPASVLEFLWISPMDFLVVSSSSLDCLHYRVRAKKENPVELIQTFSVVCPRVRSRASVSVPSRRGMSADQSSYVVRLILSPRRRDERVNWISVFAMLTTGDIFLLELDPKDLEKT